VLNVEKLARQIQEKQGYATLDSAWFAMEMIEGTPKARFHRSA
jgi:hypothetical protein